ncbi:MAG: trehalose-6-phosphate synthase [Terracidiphilus sp.]|jgi:trehalose 6-phosphate synthase
MHLFRLRLVVALLLGITLISIASTYFDVLAHEHRLRSDLARRTQWLAAGLQPQIEQKLTAGANVDWLEMLRALRVNPDQPAMAAFDMNGRLLASIGEDAPSWQNLSIGLLVRTLNSGKDGSAFVRFPEAPAQAGGTNYRRNNGSSSPRLWYEDAIPLRDGARTVAILLLVADAEYIHTERTDTWRRSFLRILAIVVLVVVVTLVMVRWFLQTPVVRAAEWLRKLRHGEADMQEGASEFGYLVPLAKEVTTLAENLNHARLAAETEAWLRDRAEHVWTAERLAVHVRERLGGDRLLVVSNREPYMHVRRGRDTECIVPPSGLVTAIEPILQACDGTWIAHGSGSEDALFVDEHDRLRVPPDERRYTLRRVWLSPEEEAGYYEGFCNEGLWPLCHIAHTRPIFRSSDWNYYKSVNSRFGEVLLEEMRGMNHPVVFVQDYHFALLPQIIKHARPDARVAIFWHIPWPNAETFGICPWQTELMNGMLGADLIGFQLQAHCNNFLQTVDRVLEARTDWEHFSVRRGGHHSLVRPYPISVAWDEHRTAARLYPSDKSIVVDADEERVLPVTTENSTAEEHRDGSARIGKLASSAYSLHRELGIEGKRLLLGVDRMDYTKGIVERLLAIEHLFQEHPWYLEQIVFVQIASPSRTRIPSYVDLRLQVKETVERINRRYETSRWKPIILIERQYSHDEVERFYRAADLCLVTSLHDGMNLVAKEYLAARNDGDGVLVLSLFTGASRELRDALLINPYDIEQMSEAIHTGLRMDPAERRLRMQRMRQQVREHNVYHWASTMLTDLCAVQIEDDLLAASLNRSRRKLA